MTFSLLTAVTLFLQSVVLASETPRQCTYAPVERLSLGDDPRRVAQIDEPSFHALIDAVDRMYRPFVERHGAELVVEKLWESPLISASAAQARDEWRVTIHGAFARRKEMTPDAFQLAVCHEFGHHLGGFPTKSSGWSAAESQADYFAAHACARRLWASDAEKNEAFRLTVPALPRSRCDAQWSGQGERDLCYRIAMASLSATTFLAWIEGGAAPRFEMPNKGVVHKTYLEHSTPQCRLDSYVSAALCSLKDFDPSVIPGKGLSAGQGSHEAEREMERYSCGGAAGSAPGVRPSCWFKSVLH
jgi:hypothetical protein